MEATGPLIGAAGPQAPAAKLEGEGGKKQKKNLRARSLAGRSHGERRGAETKALARCCRWRYFPIVAS